MRPRNLDRRRSYGRRIVSDRRREQVPVLVERRSGKDRRSGAVRRADDERREASGPWRFSLS